MVRRILLAVVCVTVLSVPAVAVAGEFQDDLAARRARVMERLPPESMLILWSASVKVYSHDVDYEFRQDSNLYYLTGIDQPDTILVLMPGNERRREILFISPRDPVREHWEGHLLTSAEATGQSGVATVYTTNEFESFVKTVLGGSAYGVGPGSQEYTRFGKAVQDASARLALLLTPKPGLSDELPATYRFVRQIQERFPGITAMDVFPILRDLRQVKTPYERKLLQESADVSSDAHMAGMKAARPGAYEYEVEAAIEFVYKKNGSLDWGYPSIVGSGPNATILHYNASTRRMADGDLLLVDAAANYKYATVDITRTYPVNGRFTPAQRELYALVLSAQEEGMKVARAGARVAEIHQKTVEVIKAGLLKLGLITDAAGDQYRIWYTHGSVHWIGLDVHDVGDNSRPLEPGMSFVIEPGVYIRESALDYLPKTAQNAAFIEKVRPLVKKYNDIGIRVEDSFLLTENGLHRLSAKVPRTIDEIEAFMRAK
jgi:Xaa-Pro aminopeptidase